MGKFGKKIVLIGAGNIGKGYLGDLFAAEGFHYPSWKIREYDTSAEVEKAVQSGEADCFVVKLSLIHISWLPVVWGNKP